MWPGGEEGRIEIAPVNGAETGTHGHGAGCPTLAILRTAVTTGRVGRTLLSFVRRVGTTDSCANGFYFTCRGMEAIHYRLDYFRFAGAFPISVLHPKIIFPTPLDIPLA